MIAALFVDDTGVYANRVNIDLWPIARDARLYRGSDKVIAHPPCQRWGRYWHGSPRKPHVYELGDDQGCFASALANVRRCGGVLEHPAYSHAWNFFDIEPPCFGEGWTKPDRFGGVSIYVEQGHYGHVSRKPTWLYGVNITTPELPRHKAPQVISERALELHGYVKARRIGVMAMIGGKAKTKLRNATPKLFAELLISMVS